MSTIPAARPLTRLHIGATETVVSIEGAIGPGPRLSMQLGTSSMGRGYFRQDPPGALEVEHAIQAVEDALSPVYSGVPPGSTLHTADPLIGRIAQVAGIVGGPEVVLGRELVELTFDRLAAMSAGRPRTQDDIPTDPEFAAALLILREFMHHLQFASITVSSETSQRQHHPGETT